MAARPILVDSCYYITVARQGVDPLRTLAIAAMERDLAVCGVVRCEVSRGIKDPKIRQKFSNFWDVMQYVPTDNRLWAEAENLLWEMDRKGQTIPLTDALIACCAQRIDAAVLTYDRHFSLIPDLEVISSPSY